MFAAHTPGKSDATVFPSSHTATVITAFMFMLSTMSSILIFISLLSIYESRSTSVNLISHTALCSGRFMPQSPIAPRPFCRHDKRGTGTRQHRHTISCRYSQTAWTFLSFSKYALINSGEFTWCIRIAINNADR